MFRWGMGEEAGVKEAGRFQVEQVRDGMELCVTFYVNRQPEA